MERYQEANLIVPKDGGFVAVKVTGAVKKTPDQLVSNTNDSSLEEIRITEPTPDHQTEIASPPVAGTDHAETSLVPS